MKSAILLPVLFMCLIIFGSFNDVLCQGEPLEAKAQARHHHHHHDHRPSHQKPTRPTVEEKKPEEATPPSSCPCSKCKPQCPMVSSCIPIINQDVPKTVYVVFTNNSDPKLFPQPPKSCKANG